MKPIDDGLVNQLAGTLGRISRETAVTAANLANADTPGYRALQVRFDDAWSAAGGVELARTRESHLGPMANSATGGTVSQVPVTRMRLDGNTVDLDREMTRLSTLSGRFSATAQMLRKHLALMRYAATDGRQ